MTTPKPEPADDPEPAGGAGPAQKLVELLESLPAADRKQIVAWLLGMGRGTGIRWLGGPLPGRLPGAPETWSTRVATLPGPSSWLGSTLPAGEGSQLVTIRLPTDRHAQLRDWCAGHGFTMASVVRGLIERFLEEQAPPASAD